MSLHAPIPSTSVAVLVCWLVVGGGCDSDGGTPTDPPPDPPPDPPSNLVAQLVVGGLSDPVYLTAPSGDDRLFIVEQPGRIRIVQNGQLVPTPFLNIVPLVLSGGERGLLSMAFHPSYAANGYFYVNYTDNGGDTRVVRYTVSADPNVADAGSAKQILLVGQPFGNHNGGHVLFGPDGFLYIAMGDGGSGGDPQNHGQDLTTLLGALLRIDVDGGDPYAIPTSNPFRGQPGARDEIWAYGLRNPWRFAFDATASTLYIADVGQNALEEVNAVGATAAPVNYGWRIMEGTSCFNPPQNCNQTGLTLPVLEYGRGSGCSVIGGFVYRGSTLSGLQGHYFYSDWCSGWLRSFRLDNGQAADQQEWNVGSIGAVLSFGQDGSGELYVLSGNGSVYRLAPGS